MTDPLVSVIMTVYNCEKYVEEAVRSILNQTYSNYEFIIYNDGSTDETMNKILPLFEGFDKHFEIVSSEENNGVGYGRNKAIELAKGKYIAIADGDDISEPNRLEKEVAFLEDNIHIFCVSSAMVFMDVAGRIGKTQKMPLDHIRILGRMIQDSVNSIHDPAAMFKREEFVFLGGYSRGVKYVPDFDLWLRAIKQGMKFHNLQHPYVKYRKNPEGNCMKHTKALLEEHKVVWNRFHNRE